MSKEQLFQLLPLPDDDLQQVLDYASTLSKAEAADHFTNMLGDSPQVIDFISTFNARRAEPKAPSVAAHSSEQSSEVDAAPKNRRPPKKKKAPLHTPPPRQVAAFAVGPGTVYNKKDQQEEYMSGRPGTSATSISGGSKSKQPAAKSATPPPQPSKPPPSAAGMLVSDLGVPKPKPKSNPVSRASTPGPSSSRNNPSTAKVSITGGVPMHGSSTALADLDQAIRSLEITTNPSHTSNTAASVAARRCNCVATRHPLLTAAPNCLNCGKVICVKEGLGPCTFCGEPLLSSAEVQSMIKELRAEKGREKMAADRAAHKKVDAGGAPRPYTAKLEPSVAEAMALQQRDKLLAFQEQNAKRTTVRDEAADFDVSLTGSMWASPEERALALKKQQKLLREMEWNAKPEYEKRQQIVSIDLAGKKVFKKTVKVERPQTPDQDEDDVGGRAPMMGEAEGNRGQGGAFSKNPLLGSLIKPVYHPDGEGTELEGRKDRKTRWRRVQDDLDDNQAVILDGGIYGGTKGAVGDEPVCG
ncbi:Activating signal cointegrator 1 [Madurella mycetomatis]|uniref:Activating signal cointegrator 1 n=1 Tax=Madurella mycetomatis TaxID=100816 RepID=A0A175W1B7_9PEZI|nr:Activating signal cointegrator 1 [Madurella mycetomatis]